MKSIIITNKTQNTVLADKAKKADNFFTRFIGLLNRKSLDIGEGLYIVPCNSIHSCFMKFTFDAVFVNQDMEVIYIIESMAKFKFSPIIKGAKGVIELPPGVVSMTSTALGDKIEVEG